MKCDRPRNEREDRVEEDLIVLGVTDGEERKEMWRITYRHRCHLDALKRIYEIQLSVGITVKNRAHSVVFWSLFFF